MRPVDEAEEAFRVLTTDLFAARETILIANFKPPLHREDSLAARAGSVNFPCDRRLLSAMFVFAIS
jgi:hypothetical protein